MSVIDCPGLVWERQGYSLTTTHSVHNYIIRTVVDLDHSHPSQSRIYAEVWNPNTLTWNRTVTRQGQAVGEVPYLSRDTMRKREEAMALLAHLDEDMLVYTIGLLDVRP